MDDVVRSGLEAMLRAEELVRFRDELRPLYASLAGRAKFETMEEWLRIEVAGDGKGHFHATCAAIDQPGIGNRLTFGINFDQSELQEMTRALDAICDAFPVVATPA